MNEHRFLAFDIGAESGRAVVGTLEGDLLSLEEIHRFVNEPVEVRGTLHWDILSLYSNVLKAMRTCSERFGESVDGIGVNTWAVDFGLLAADGSLLQNPVHYRDRRTEGMPAQVCQQIPGQQLFQFTGMSLFPIQTLCQLLSLRISGSPVMGAATTFLMMPDLFAYFLTDQKRCERTNATMTQLYDPRAGEWHKEVFNALGLPRAIMPDLVDPGTVLGPLRESVAQETGLEQVTVIAPCTHDTGSAVAAVPGRGDDWAFLSSGTWSILGALTDEVVTSPEAHAAGLCNELTLDSPFLCSNIMGLWLLQQARAVWQRSGESHSYAELVKLAEGAPDGGPLVHPNDSGFLAPEDMVQAIRQYCRGTDQPEPQGIAETTRCILESLALCYRHGLDQLAEILDRSFSVLHIVGGGSQNTLLCQFAANATRLPVSAGPVEATAAGNVLVQALALGHVGAPQAIRDMVRQSFTLVEYEPRETRQWEDRYGRYIDLVERKES